jgi:hypothetical protein
LDAFDAQNDRMKKHPVVFFAGLAKRPVMASIHGMALDYLSDFNQINPARVSCPSCNGCVAWCAAAH